MQNSHRNGRGKSNGATTITLPRDFVEQWIRESRTYAAKLNATDSAARERASLGLSSGPHYAIAADVAEAWMQGDFDRILIVVGEAKAKRRAA